MKIFVSYPRSHSEIASDLVARLRAENHEVFIDASSLPPGESYDTQIRDSIQDCELFVSLFAGDSLRTGTYSRTEMKFAAEKWPNPSGNVLPVALDEEAMNNIPSYLKSVTVMRPEGEIVADVIAEVTKIARRPMRKVLGLAKLAGILIVAGLVGWFVYREFIDVGDVDLKVSMSGPMYENHTSGDTQTLSGATEYLLALKNALAGGFELGDRLYQLLEKDMAGYFEDQQSPLPTVNFAMVNNTSESVIIDRVRVQVASSETNLEPLPWAVSRNPHGSDFYNGEIELGNNGWGPMEDIVFDFDLVPEGDLADAEGNSDRTFSQPLGQRPSGEIARFELWEQLASFGQSVDFVRYENPCGSPDMIARFETEREAIMRAMGAEQDEPVYAVGELSYAASNGDRETLGFKQEFHIVYTCMAVAPAMMSETFFEIELLPDGKDYTREISIAWSLEPGKAEPFGLRIFVERSSFHDMTVAIRANGEWVEASDKLKLEYYMPKNAIWASARQSESE